MTFHIVFFNQKFWCTCSDWTRHIMYSEFKNDPGFSVYSIREEF